MHDKALNTEQVEQRFKMSENSSIFILRDYKMFLSNKRRIRIIEGTSIVILIIGRCK